MPAQGELRGPQAARKRHGGGDWDAHASDLASPVFVEPNPGDRCRAYRVGSTSLLPAEGAFSVQPAAAGRCDVTAPLGSSICTPCHRRRIAARYRRLSHEHRARIAAETGRPIEEIP